MLARHAPSTLVKHMVDRCQSPPNWVRILVDVDECLLAKIESLAWELEESRQNLLRRFIEKGLKRERRRLSRGRRTVSPAHTGSRQVGAISDAAPNENQWQISRKILDFWYCYRCSAT